MANQDAPFGAGGVTRTGSNYIGEVNEYYIPSSNSDVLAVGDFVVSKHFPFRNQSSHKFSNKPPNIRFKKI